METDGLIESGTAAMMFAVAFVIDMFQAILDFLLIGMFISPFVDLVAALIFGIWFFHKNVKAGMGVFATAILEFIPGVNAIPGWTGYVTYKIITSRKK